MIRVIVATIVLLLITVLASFAQTNPCTAPLTTVYAPAGVVAQFDDYDVKLADGATPVWDETTLGIFSQGVDPNVGTPVSTIAISRAQWVLVTGTSNCYGARPAPLIALPITSLQVAALKARRTTIEPAESPWSGLSNPFARTAAPLVPRAVRITK